jgi:hypothetical protein
MRSMPSLGGLTLPSRLQQQGKGKQARRQGSGFGNTSSSQWEAACLRRPETCMNACTALPALQLLSDWAVTFGLPQ